MPDKVISTDYSNQAKLAEWKFRAVQLLETVEQKDTISQTSWKQAYSTPQCPHPQPCWNLHRHQTFAVNILANNVLIISVLPPVEGPLHPSCHTFWVNRLWKSRSLQRWLRRTFICRAPTKAAHDNPAEILSRGIQQVIKDKHPSVWKMLWNRLMAKAHGCLNPCKQRDTKLKIVLVDFCARSNPMDCVIQQLYSGMKSIVIIRRWNIF